MNKNTISQDVLGFRFVEFIPFIVAFIILKYKIISFLCIFVTNLWI